MVLTASEGQFYLAVSPSLFYVAVFRLIRMTHSTEWLPSAWVNYAGYIQDQEVNLGPRIGRTKSTLEFSSVK